MGHPHIEHKLARKHADMLRRLQELAVEIELKREAARVLPLLEAESDQLKADMEALERALQLVDSNWSPGESKIRRYRTYRRPGSPFPPGRLTKLATAVVRREGPITIPDVYDILMREGGHPVQTTEEAAKVRDAIGSAFKLANKKGYLRHDDGRPRLWSIVLD